MSSNDRSTSVEYRDVLGFPGYRIGDDGSCWSLYKRPISTMGTEWRQLPGSINAHGYRVYCLTKDKKTHYFFGHRLVLEAFVGPRPDGMQCRHLDGDPSNNHLENICWGTSKENIGDRVGHGTAARGELNGRHKLSNEDVETIRRLRSEGVHYKVIAKRFGICFTTMYRIFNRTGWTDS